MVADLVDEDMGDDVLQRLVVLGPVVEDRPAIEPDVVGHLAREGCGGAVRHALALEQAEDVANAFAYLDSKSVTPVYIDVRVAGKAFYR